MAEFNLESIIQRGVEKALNTPVHNGKSITEWADIGMKRSWIPFKIRPLTDEEKEHHPDLIFMFDCPLPDDGDEILVSFLNGTVWVDEWTNDADECGLASGNDVEEGMAWMPMPEAYRREG